MLLEEFLKPMGLTQRQLADGIHVLYQAQACEKTILEDIQPFTSSQISPP